MTFSKNRKIDNCNIKKMSLFVHFRGRYVIQIKEQNVNLKVFLWPFVIVLGVCLIISVGFLVIIFLIKNFVVSSNLLFVNCLLYIWLRYVGHVYRSKHADLMTTALQGKVEGKRRKGRPPISYIDNLKDASSSSLGSRQ